MSLEQAGQWRAGRYEEGQSRERVSGKFFGDWPISDIHAVCGIS